MERSQECVDRELKGIRMVLIEPGYIKISDPNGTKKIKAIIDCVSDEISFKALENNRAIKEKRERPYRSQEIVNLRVKKFKLEKKLNEFNFLLDQSREGISTKLFKISLLPDSGLIVIDDVSKVIRKDVELAKDLRKSHVKWSENDGVFKGYLSVANLIGVKNTIKKYEAKYSASYKRK